MMKTDRGIVDLAYPVRCCDENGTFKYLKTVTYPAEYIITAEQQELARKRLEERKKELIDGVKPGELVFVRMGSTFRGKTPDHTGQHRMRCEFKNLEGNQFFIELGSTCREDEFSFSYSIDRQLEKKYHEEEREVIEHNSRTLNRNLWKKLPQQYQYNAKGMQNTRHEEYTWTRILDIVNGAYGCNYTSARCIDHIVRCEDICSTCK